MWHCHGLKNCFNNHMTPGGIAFPGVVTDTLCTGGFLRRLLPPGLLLSIWPFGNVRPRCPQKIFVCLSQSLVSNFSTNQRWPDSAVALGHPPRAWPWAATLLAQTPLPSKATLRSSWSLGNRNRFTFFGFSSSSLIKDTSIEYSLRTHTTPGWTFGLLRQVFCWILLGAH